MFCPKCGAENVDPAVSCVSCGFDLRGVMGSQKEGAIQSPQTCGLAVWSLCLGLGGFILCLFTSIPAIICGHIALGRIKASEGKLTGRGMAIAGLVLGYIFIGFFFSSILIGLLLPAVGRAREMAKRAVCASNLKQIGIACQIYAQDNQKMFPDKLSRLYPKYLPSTQTFVCPSEKAGSSRDLSSSTAIDTNSSYRFFPDVKSTDRPDKILAEEKSEDHNKEGRNILHVDGSVIWEKTK